MNKEYRYLSTYNRYIIIDKVKAKLRDLGAKILLGPFDKELEIEVMTNETDTEKVKRLKLLPNLIVNSWYLKLCFIYNNTYYHLSWDNNPFFENRIEKIKLDEDGKTYHGDRYSQDYKELNMCYDNIFTICDEKMLDDMTDYFWEKLLKFINSNFESKIVSQKKRVYLGNKYHYETKYDNKIHYIYKDNDIDLYNKYYLQLTEENINKGGKVEC